MDWPLAHWLKATYDLKFLQKLRLPCIKAEMVTEGLLCNPASRIGYPYV